jgi:Uncharacterized conserved protein
MTVHGDFSLTRDIRVPVERAFAAFADPAQKKVWFTDGPDWETTDEAFDFRVGGTEIAEGRLHSDGVVSRFVARYTNIVENERIVLTYDMVVNGTHISTSVACYEFEPIDGGTRFTHTEHGVHFEGGDSPAQREEGTREIIETLVRYLEGRAAD